MADGWKTDGNCETCRRQKYCNKLCRPRQERNQWLLEKQMSEVVREFQQKHDSEYNQYIEGVNLFE